MREVFTNGRDIILVGPQGSGKTGLARKLAEFIPPALELDYADYLLGNGCIKITEDIHPSTVVVDGVPDGYAISCLINLPTILVRNLYQRSKRILRPRLIICVTPDVAGLELRKSPHLYKVGIDTTMRRREEWPASLINSWLMDGVEVES